MSNIDAELDRLIAPGRVHRRIYTDPAIFELEMDRIFGAAWIYVGHESQIKKPGDYFATLISPTASGETLCGSEMPGVAPVQVRQRASASQKPPRRLRGVTCQVRRPLTFS